jgi:hypothetical protein
MSARGPSWFIPIEAVRAMADGNGTELLARLSCKHALFAAHAELILTERRFHADIRYELPAFPGREQTAAVSLITAPQENALAGVRMEGVRS